MEREDKGNLEEKGGNGRANPLENDVERTTSWKIGLSDRP